MRIGVIGAGNIGGNAARLFVAAGHDVLLSFSRDPAKLDSLASPLGERARAGTVAEAARFGPVVMLSVPWPLIDTALELAGGLDGSIVIDTTNPFGPGGLQPLPPGVTAAQFNQARIPGAQLVKSFNTLTSGFQAEAARRTGPERVVLFYAGDHPDAHRTVAELIGDVGFVPVEVGGLDHAAVMEAPRRPGSVYGEEYREQDAVAAVQAWRTGEQLRPAPVYSP